MKHRKSNTSQQRRHRGSGRKVYPQFVGKVQMTREGFIFVIVDGQEQDIFVKASKTRHALDSDTVRVAITKPGGRDGRPEGEVVEIVSRGNRRFVGYYHTVGAQAWVLMQSKSMPYDIEVNAEGAAALGAKTGLKVAAVVDRWDRADSTPRGHVVDVLGEPGQNDTEMHAILSEFNLPYRFEPEVEKAADSISDRIGPAEMKGRRDFRDTLTFTIDPSDAKDFDDAISFKALPNGNYEVGVHIADVSWYVRPGDVVDREARERGTSVYLVDRTVPMLPEKLCNKLCSLRPDEDKLTFSAVFEMAPDGNVVSSWIGRTAIRSNYRFDYAQAQTIIDSGQELASENVSLSLDPTVRSAPVPPLTLPRVARFSEATPAPNATPAAGPLPLEPRAASLPKQDAPSPDEPFPMEPRVARFSEATPAPNTTPAAGPLPLEPRADSLPKQDAPSQTGPRSGIEEAVAKSYELAMILRDRRFKEGAINFDRPEMKVEVDADGKPIRVYQHLSTEANWMIEEWMLLANRTVAEFIATGGRMNAQAQKNAKTFVYRVHDDPNFEKLCRLGEFARGFGYRMKDISDGRAAAASLRTLLAEAKGKPEFNAFENIALRCMSKAVYSTVNIGHYGLAFRFYTHFTSPIRRYPDLMVHRLLADYLSDAESRNQEKYESECRHASERETLATDAERTSIKYKLVEFMQDKVGQEFEGNVSGMTERGMYVEIQETKIEGMVPLREIRSDFYDFDEDHYRLVGRRHHKVFRLGDSVRIKVKNANLEQRLLDYELVENPEDFKDERTPEGDAVAGAVTGSVSGRHHHRKPSRKAKEAESPARKSSWKRSKIVKSEA